MIARYRKAIAAGLAAALATVPVAALVSGDMTDYRGALAAAVNAAIVAMLTALSPANAHKA